MSVWMYHLMNVVGQALPRPPFDDSPPPAAPAAPAVNRGMNFSDLQNGFRTQLNGDTHESHYRHLMWAVMVVVVLAGVLLHLRQRRKTGGPPESVGALARELSGCIRFPFGSRLLLWWVARAGKVPMAALLVSEELFGRHVSEWSQQPTFGPLRQWGAGRLGRLQSGLFAAAGESVGDVSEGK